LELVDFFIGSITPPDDVQKVIDERSGMGAIGGPNMGSYMQFKAARALGDAAAGSASGGGSAVAAGVGVGAGAGIGLMIPGMLREAAASAAQGPVCTQCGTKKAAPGTCPGCGEAAPPGARFCSGCGARL
jgi:membrane protease subunit (stomatin/prohibitin family)